MTLPTDITRCAGRFGLRPADPICERRETCARYLDLLAHGDGEVSVSVATGLCRDGDDFRIEVSV